MTGHFDICGDRFFVAFQGRPDPNHEAIFLAYLRDVWQRIPPHARQTILSKYELKVLVYSRLKDRRSFAIGGKSGSVPWPIAEAGAPPELFPNDSDAFLFSCDRMRLFDMPKERALMVIGEELTHRYLMAANTKRFFGF